MNLYFQYYEPEGFYIENATWHYTATIERLGAISSFDEYLTLTIL